MDRRYLWCSECDLIHVPASDHVNLDTERKRYLSHNNSRNEPGYTRVLHSVILAAEAVTDKSSFDLLDFGCGYAPVLGELAQEKGHRVTNYDPIFFPQPDALKQEYDVVTACEVAEHARDPVLFWERLASVVAPGGTLVVRSSLHPSAWDEFLRFWYTFDMTHVTFYSRVCVEYAARRFGFEPCSIDDPIWVMKKRSSACREPY
ncbi:MAG: class I SAM-dependent methyltransferase [Spirochaetaceae bacterium]